jgi:hypothetical protein
MVNHVRTLLVNLSGKVVGLSSGLSGAGYVPAEFSPYDTPVILRYRGLFGFMTSRDPQNRIDAFNAAASIIHSPGLGSWATRYDSRLTYDPLSLPGNRAALATLLSELARHENSATLAALASEPVVAANPSAALLSSNDALARLGAVLLAYVDVHHREREATWRQ